MKRSLAVVVALLAMFALAGTSLPFADARNNPAPDFLVADVEPVPLPDDFRAIALWGEVWANGQNIGAVDFALIFAASGGDPVDAQLWAFFDGQRHQVCIGEIFTTPSGEPIFFGDTALQRPAGTCHMARTGGGGVSLFAASEDGQWATAILRASAPGVDAASVF